MEVQSWISKVNPAEPDSSVLNACNKLVTLMRDQPDLKQHLINNATIIQTVNLLEACEQKRDVLLAVLQLVNEMLSNNVDKRKNTIQTNFCLLGGIPAVTRYASPHYPKPLRLETANFINQMSGCNPLVLHMFIACGGLSVLTTLLETNYNAFKTLIQATIRSIWNIFHIQILPKNDFCHLFSKCGLMDRLATALGHFYYDSQATEYLRKTCDIMFYFSQASLDTAVQKSMCTTPVLARIKAVLDGEIKPEYHILWLLHTVRNLSMHINARSALEAAGFIPVLIRFLRRTDEFSEEEKGNVTKYVDERENVTLTKIHNQVLNTMLNICNMDYANHEKVALAGIVPSLMWFIEEGSVHFLKELSLKLFLAMPHSSGRVRELLWECDAFPVYMRLLQDGSWYVDVLQCLLKWRRLDSARMDAEMEKSAEYLVDVFSFCGKPGFQKALEPLLDIVQESVPVNVAMREGGVIPKILVGLTKEEKNPHAQCTLLKILLALLEATPKDAVDEIVHQHQLVPVIRQIHATTTKLLVKNIAQRLLAMKAFQ